MKILPFISTIEDMLSYGNAMQVRTGFKLLVAETISYHSYDPMMQLAFKTSVEKMIVVYAGLKIEKCILFVNITYAYNAVVEHYSKMNNPLNLMKKERCRSLLRSICKKRQTPHCPHYFSKRR